MKSLIYSILILFVSVNLHLNAQDFKSYDKDGVSLMYPSDWEVVDIEKKKEENPNNPMLRSILFEIVADKETKETKTVEAMRIDMAGKNASLSDVENFFDKLFKNSQGKVQILKKGDGKVNGYEYKSMTLRTEVDEAQLLGVQRMLLDGKYAYVISVNTPLAEFANYKTTVNQILDSFKIK